jgi:hypothetical protein
MPVKLKPEDALKRMKDMWPEYDFSKYVFSGNYGESIVICKIHGEQIRTFKNVVKNGGIACGKCASNLQGTTESFIVAAKEKFPHTWDKCDFSKVEYARAQTKVIITCKEHGDFLVKPCNILTKKAKFLCSKCNIFLRSENQTYTTEQFLSLVPVKNHEIDSFEKVVYISSKEYVEIVCKEHGPYFIIPNDYLSGKRCSHCSKSKKSTPELELFEFIKELCPSAVTRVRPIKDLNLELDIYIPNLKLGIEYNGLFFHRDINLALDKNLDFMANKTTLKEKTEIFNSRGVRVIHIFEDEWIEKEEIVKARMRSILGKDERIFARNCKVFELSESECKSFIDKLHIQGHSIGSSNRYGLKLGTELVACMTFSRPRYSERVEGEYELLRFCSSKSVVGGFSKLLSTFIREASPIKIISYSDARWSLGNVYLKNGFKKIGTSQPGYFWFKSQKRFNRVVFQRHKLDEIFKTKFPKEMTEAQILYSRGYLKIKDCGQDIWEWKPQ